MPTLPSELHLRCLRTLQQCRQFESDTLLRAVFATQELKPFREGLTNSTNKEDRVDICLSYLLGKQLNDGRPALLLFLDALRERYEKGDALRDELDALRNTLEDALNFRFTTPPTSTRHDINTLPQLREDWGEAIDVGALYGRQMELDRMKQWILDDRCRLIAVVGMGGMGKTSLVKWLAEQIKGHFDYLFWRDLRNAPPVESILVDCIKFLSDYLITDLPEGIDGKIKYLVLLLKQHRCMLVLDNAETILHGGAGSYGEGYQGYGELIRQVGIGGTSHGSCLILTSREPPKEIVSWSGERSPVRLWKLSGLEQKAGRRLLEDRDLQGEDRTWGSLIDHYEGNPLALKQVSATIQDLFGGRIDRFLETSVTVFGDIRQVLDQQVARLTDLEIGILYWLAIEREVVSWEMLLEDMQDTGQPVRQHQLLDALASLRYKSLIETSAGLYTLQPVVMEYVTNQFIERICEEMRKEKISLFASHALIKGEAKEYVRESQIRLVLKPVMDNLIASGKKDAENKLNRILYILREQFRGKAGYAGGNLLNLLVHFKGDLRDFDFSELTIRQAYLLGVDLHRLNFSCCNLVNCVFTEPFGSIITVAFSPDGSLFAAGTANCEIRFWRAVDNHLVHICREHTDWIRAIAFSPDGRLLASCSGDQTVKLWDVNSGHCLRTLHGHTNIVRSVAFSPDGNRLASSSDDQTICLWEVTTGLCLKTLREETSWVWAILFSPDGQTLISGNEDTTIRLWNVSSGECKAILQGHAERVRTIALSPDNTDLLLASGSDDKTVRLWDLGTGECIHIWGVHTDRIESVAFSQDGHILASGSDDQTVRLWDVRNYQCCDTLRGHTARVRSVAFNPSGDSLVSGGDDHLGIWDIRKGRCIRILQGHVNVTGSVAFSSVDPFLLASGHYDHTVRLWNSRHGTGSKILRGHTKPVWSVAFSPDGQVIASGSDDQTINLWNANSDHCFRTLRGHSASVMSVAFSPKGHILASGSLDYTVRLWDFNTGQPLRILQEHTNRVKAVAFSPNGGIVASCSEDHTVKLWDVHTGTCLYTLKGHINRVTSVAFSSDGNMLASGGEDDVICLWDVHTGQCLKTLKGHSSRVWSVSFRVGDNMLASCSEDHTVRLWDINTGQCLTVLEGHDSRVWSVTFNSGGHVLASSSGPIKLWDIQHISEIPEPRTLECEKPYAHTNITGVTGLTEEQKISLKELGAFEE
ncbi:MAG: NB-ARC domain-containing protein [Chloroflexi bacterium]|nr:NB-ARC domain-containing protein [Chloroflexota bacterium]